MARQPAASGEAERYRTLLEINNALVSNLTRDSLFHAIARALRRVVPFERTAIFLHDPGAAVLKLYILEATTHRGDSPEPNECAGGSPSSSEAAPRAPTGVGRWRTGGVSHEQGR